MIRRTSTHAGYNGMGRHGKKPLATADARIQLISLLYSCTDAKLAEFTPEFLAKTHRLAGHPTANLREITGLLAKARASRVAPLLGLQG